MVNKLYKIIAAQLKWYNYIIVMPGDLYDHFYRQMKGLTIVSSHVNKDWKGKCSYR